MLRLILTIGAPRSGKDTWSKQFISQQDNLYKWRTVNRDTIRKHFFPFDKWSEYKFTKAKEQHVTDTQFDLLNSYAADGLNIICTDTNLSEKTRNRFKQWADENGYAVEYQLFDVPLHILEERNADAPYGVSPKVLVDMYLRMQKYLGREYKPDTSLQPAYIIDIDGTLADHTGIRSPFEWNKVGLDNVRENVANLVRMAYRTGTKIIILSGRDGCCEELTKQWLFYNDIPYDRFLMRKAGDARKDYVIKEELFNQVKDEFNIVLAVDDRDQVVNLWRGMGIECWQTNYGKF